MQTEEKLSDTKRRDQVCNRCDQTAYIQPTLNCDDPENPFYIATSRFHQRLAFTENFWLVHHVCTGETLPGHSMIVVEGLRAVTHRSSMIFQPAPPQVFVGYYHLAQAYDIIEREAGVYRVMKEIYTHHHKQRHYISNRSWVARSKQEVQKMIDSIQAGEKVAYNFRGKHSVVALMLGEGRKHNCTSWAMEKLKLAGIEDPVKWVDLFKDKPKHHTLGCRCAVM